MPNRAVRFEEGMRVIHLLEKGNISEPVEIEIGGTSDVFSEVIGGDVEEGDVVVLNPPRVFSPPGPPGTN